jgi:hypothetical protein
MRNDGLGLSPEERALVDAGVDALDTLTKRTFEDWLAIGRALQMLKQKPGGDDRTRWPVMREEAGFGAIERAVVSRLLQIMDHEDEVVEWRATLPTNKKIAWCGPAAIMRNCPAFNKPAASKKPKKDGDTINLQQTRRAYVALLPDDHEARRKELVLISP